MKYDEIKDVYGNRVEIIKSSYDAVCLINTELDLLSLNVEQAQRMIRALTAFIQETQPMAIKGF